MKHKNTGATAPTHTGEPMETFKVYLAAVVTTVVAIAGPFAFTYAVASIAPILGGPALAIGIVAIPALACKAGDIICGA